jgi:Tfp pilus assembly protein PilX
MVVLLAVFAVMMILAGVWARQFIAENRSQRLAADRLQAKWLAEAGVRRAAAQLLESAEYDGEQWEVPAEDLNQPHPASVLIHVQPGDTTNEMTLVARARYPADDHRVQFTKTVNFSLPNQESQP